ncbi:hypothetical protein ETD83_14720 [Actinomadura soli]|uniref:Uncharacterized protein n=1 Tax=Actinomadura soli TaxID=2508997 RepID=A0A5C4JCA7_9ACTN|nr:hypothetical protein [Actinomadura soli]TMR01250.1 hypothetical protein ETD83_14720 [Actinomadura soli]
MSVLAVPLKASAGPPPEWEIFRPTGKQEQASLTRVAAPGRNDAWAMGSTAFHWNGRAWRQVRVPHVGGVNDVSAASAKDVWAAGDKATLHWSGRRWTKYAYVDPRSSIGGQFPSAISVKAINPRDAWLAGNVQKDAGGVNPWQGFVQRWNGKKWQLLHIPELGAGSLTTVGASARHDVWIAGDDAVDNLTQAIILRWNGRTWKRWIVAPSNPGWETSLQKVLALSGSDVWAVGYTWANGNGPGGRRPMALHWNGHGWARTPVPDEGAQLTDVVKAGGHLWASGYTTGGTPYALHWTGRRWTKAPVPRIAQGSFYGLAGIPGSGLWAVGSRYVGNDAYPLIARHR